MNHRLSLFAAIIGAIALLFTSCSVMEAKKPTLKNSKWVCEKKMFVADVGTGTETYTLQFTSGKECLYIMSWYLPAHPSMYKNPDGTIDTNPARSSETIHKCTWEFRKGMLTLTYEDGKHKVFYYKDNTFVTQDPFIEGGEMVFEKQD